MINPWSTDEEDHSYNGPFSHKAETHSFLAGIFHGFRLHPLSNSEFNHLRWFNPQIDEEPYYFKAGYVIGSSMKILLVLKALRKLRDI